MTNSTVVMVTTTSMVGWVMTSVPEVVEMTPMSMLIQQTLKVRRFLKPLTKVAIPFLLPA